MQCSARLTRSKVSPGLIDQPNPRCSSKAIAEEKTKKKKAATLKAEEQRRHAAQVAKVEEEIRKAQAEAQQVGQRGGGGVIKKTFRCPGGDANVSSWIRSPTFPLILTTDAGHQD